jgi:hypothetical protein
MNIASPHDIAVESAMARVVSLAAEAGAQNDLLSARARLNTLRMAIITAVTAIDIAEMETRRQARERLYV